MYEDFFGMARTPFLNSMPESALYLSNEHRELLGRLQYAAEKRMFAVVSADVGCGKSTMIRKFRATIDHDRFMVLYLADSMLTPRWFYKGLLEQLGIEAKFYRGDAKRQLHRQLALIRETHRKDVVTVVDEAHLLDRETFEEIRFLLNCDMDSCNPMALFLCGQGEIWDKLKLQQYAAIRQRIDIKCFLPAFDRSQTGEYIRAHLNHAGVEAELFTDAAKDEVYKYSAGAARAINKACTHALMSAAQTNKKLIDDAIVKNVVEREMADGPRARR
ncbi:MAG: AAA family ATPase [Clostridiales bacterium]|jgi:type II secretory pathway predicted ATPase ExeA|nr:AAA family ATPase [Clostridiales bacterium]